MGIQLFIFGIFLYLFSVFGQSNRMIPMRFAKVTSHVYMYSSFMEFNGKPYPSYGIYLVTEAGIVLVDTPWHPVHFQQLLDSVAKRHDKRVIMQISTHFHDDRTAGVSYYKKLGIDTYMTQKTDSIMAVRQSINRAKHLITKDTVFRIGGRKLELYYPGPGHTVDNIVIWLERDKILYTGCFIKGNKARTLGNLQDAHCDNWPGSIKRMKEKNRKYNKIITGHQGMSDLDAIEYTLALLREHNGKKNEIN